MKEKYCKFTVIGKCPFPMDMLHYESCYPASSADAAEIAESLELRMEKRKPFRVTLVKQGNLPKADRWASFLWKVVMVNGVTYE